MVRLPLPAFVFVLAVAPLLVGWDKCGPTYPFDDVTLVGATDDGELCLHLHPADAALVAVEPRKDGLSAISPRDCEVALVPGAPAGAVLEMVDDEGHRWPLEIGDRGGAGMGAGEIDEIYDAGRSPDHLTLRLDDARPVRVLDGLAGAPTGLDVEILTSADGDLVVVRTRALLGASMCVGSRQEAIAVLETRRGRGHIARQGLHLSWEEGQTLERAARVTPLHTLTLETEMSFDAVIDLAPLDGINTLETLVVSDSLTVASLDDLDDLPALDSLTLGRLDAATSLTPLTELSALTTLVLTARADAPTSLDASPLSSVGLHHLRLDLYPEVTLDGLALDTASTLRTLELDVSGSLELERIGLPTGLEHLSVRGERVETGDALVALTNLKSLRLRGVEGLPALAPGALETLELDAVGGDLAAIGALISLRRLSLDDDSLSSLEGLEGLERLEALVLGYGVEIDDLSPLGALPRLRLVAASEATITSHSASVLADHKPWLRFETRRDFLATAPVSATLACDTLATAVELVGDDCDALPGELASYPQLAGEMPLVMPEPSAPSPFSLPEERTSPAEPGAEPHAANCRHAVERLEATCGDARALRGVLARLPDEVRGRLLPSELTPPRPAEPIDKKRGW